MKIAENVIFLVIKSDPGHHNVADDIAIDDENDDSNENDTNDVDDNVAADKNTITTPPQTTTIVMRTTTVSTRDAEAEAVSLNSLYRISGGIATNIITTFWRKWQFRSDNSDADYAGNDPNNDNE